MRKIGGILLVLFCSTGAMAGDLSVAGDVTLTPNFPVEEATPAPSPTVQPCGPQADPLKPCQPAPIFPLEQLSQRVGQLQQGVVQAIQQQAAQIQALDERLKALESKKK